MGIRSTRHATVVDFRQFQVARASRQVVPPLDRVAETGSRQLKNIGPTRPLSARQVEHRRRMLRCLEAASRD